MVDPRACKYPLRGFGISLRREMRTSAGPFELECHFSQGRCTLEEKFSHSLDGFGQECTAEVQSALKNDVVAERLMLTDFPLNRLLR